MKAKVEVRISQENKVWILYKGVVIHETYLSDNNKGVEYQNKVDGILSMKKYYRDTNICDI